MKFNPGFRISKLDMAVILISVIGGILLYSQSAVFSFIVMFVVCHFFLYCNVIRMSRIPELIWASVFSTLCIISLRFGLLSWEIAILLSLLTTAILVAVELRKPSYHGVFWQKVNPNLPVWFSEKQAAPTNS